VINIYKIFYQIAYNYDYTMLNLFILILKFKNSKIIRKLGNYFILKRKIIFLNYILNNLNIFKVNLDH